MDANYKESEKDLVPKGLARPSTVLSSKVLSKAANTSTGHPAVSEHRSGWMVSA
jgi:hypothetical protein